MGVCPVASASQICEMRRPNGPCNTRGSGSRRKRFPQWASRRQEQNFFGQRLSLNFDRSRPARDQISKTVRRTGRANAACFHKVSVTRDSGDCLVADAVLVEPVSKREFPANREINSEFHQIPARGAILIADT